ncbi:hypothetical protein N2599_05145 [Rhizobium sullae]|uniref:Uncharacterized protein n=1 Tax=Rhizobium sullae TaxID=50338 RepID=A0ABY5XLB1_RHISU|nr:hypothetical protein [Rhizobium sullae]UWU15395.1 hypothetical protein N2599_05145 [Rhizobium sullae]
MTQNRLTGYGAALLWLSSATAFWRYALHAPMIPINQELSSCPTTS